jgi:hypothetical protein
MYYRVGEVAHHASPHEGMQNRFKKFRLYINL